MPLGVSICQVTLSSLVVAVPWEQPASLPLIRLQNCKLHLSCTHSDLRLVTRIGLKAWDYLFIYLWGNCVTSWKSFLIIMSNLTHLVLVATDVTVSCSNNTTTSTPATARPFVIITSHKAHTKESLNATSAGLKQRTLIDHIKLEDLKTQTDRWVTW